VVATNILKTIKQSGLRVTKPLGQEINPNAEAMPDSKRLSLHLDMVRWRNQEVDKIPTWLIAGFIYAIGIGLFYVMFFHPFG
jgi:hypothetical protein